MARLYAKLVLTSPLSTTATISRSLLALGMTLAVAACVNSPTGRSQFKLYSDQKMSKAGDQSYKKLRKQKQIDHNKANNRFVSCVVKNLSRVTKHKWRVTVFKSDQANAFAIPGGNIGVYSGILPVTHNDAQLAAVLGHEMGHVRSGHANERMSQKAATSVGLSVLSAAIGSQTGGIGQRSIMGLLGTGAKIGVLLPFSRAQEAEADRIGLDLMAKAGFDPRQAVNLWRNMAEQGGEKPPQLLSTHPSDRNRIQNLEKHMTKALAIYRRAPRHPNCQHP